MAPIAAICQWLSQIGRVWRGSSLRRRSRYENVPQQCATGAVGLPEVRVSRSVPVTAAAPPIAASQLQQKARWRVSRCVTHTDNPWAEGTLRQPTLETMAESEMMPLRAWEQAPDANRARGVSQRMTTLQASRSCWRQAPRRGAPGRSPSRQGKAAKAAECYSLPRKPTRAPTSRRRSKASRAKLRFSSKTGVTAAVKSHP